MITSTRVSLRALSRSTRSRVVNFSSTASAHVTQHPKPSVTLDPSLKLLLEDVDISLMSQKNKKSDESTSLPTRELEMLENDEGQAEYLDIHEEHEDYPDDEHARRREHRKSPAAQFGSDGFGTVILSAELHRSVTELIDRSNKPLLHSDAKRLFAEDQGSREKWSTAYDVEYKNRRQRYEHGERDGTAFASVILPSHYSAIYAVLHHVKHRLGESWKVDTVIDWGAGTGSGLWAALNMFQKTIPESVEGATLANSTIDTYFGIDKREGLVTIGKQLLRYTKLGRLTTTWKKSSDEAYRVDPSDGHSTIALSAFMLSALPTPIAQKNMVREMWDSGAQTIILIDHNTPDGFQNITGARQYLLQLGSSESENPEMMDQPLRGSHVVAPCPHDRPCPLQHSGPSSLVCGFSQRLQRPTFVRRTKHAKEGHEDIGYSYVVIRRGPRPDSRILDATGPVGRIGGVEREAMERAKARTSLPRELQRAAEHSTVEPESPSVSAAARSASAHAQSLTSTDAKSISADQYAVPPRVPMDDGVATSGEVHVQVASVHAAAPLDSPRADEILPDEHLARAQVQQVVSSSTSPSTPSISDTTKLASESLPLTSQGNSTSALRPESELEESPSKLEEALRREAYEWPRLVFPPLKKSGHIIIDACTREGKIMRMTIPRSQGKQPFYDARKSAWGDIFPHPPKNKPIERFQPPEDGSTSNAKGSDIGKRSKGRDKKAKPEQRSYAALDDKLRKEQLARKKAATKEYKREKDDEAIGLHPEEYY